MQFQAFKEEASDIADAFERLLGASEVAFLATVSRSGRPRLHPFVPKVVEGRLLAFIMDNSPKLDDLDGNGHYALHTLPGDEDEECYLAGKTLRADQHLFEPAAAAMGFATGVDEHHVLFELGIDRALWTRWLDFGTADHRPLRKGWREGRGPFTR